MQLRVWCRQLTGRGWGGRGSILEPRLSGGVTTVTRACRTTRSPPGRQGPSFSSPFPLTVFAFTSLDHLQTGR